MFFDAMSCALDLAGVAGPYSKRSDAVGNSVEATRSLPAACLAVEL